MTTTSGLWAMSQVVVGSPYCQTAREGHLKVSMGEAGSYSLDQEPCHHMIFLVFFLIFWGQGGGGGMGEERGSKWRFGMEGSGGLGEGKVNHLGR